MIVGEVVELRDFSFRSDRYYQDNFGMDQQHWRTSFSLFEEQTKSWSWGVYSLWKEGNKTAVWSFVTGDNFLSADTIFKLVIKFIYVYGFIPTHVYAVHGLVTVFLFFTCLSWSHYWNCANILFSGFWIMLNIILLIKLCCKLMTVIVTYMVYKSVAWSW